MDVLAKERYNKYLRRSSLLSEVTCWRPLVYFKLLMIYMLIKMGNISFSGIIKLYSVLSNQVRKKKMNFNISSEEVNVCQRSFVCIVLKLKLFFRKWKLLMKLQRNFSSRCFLPYHISRMVAICKRSHKKRKDILKT